MQILKHNPEFKKVYTRMIILNLILFLTTLILTSFLYIRSNAQIQNLTLQNNLQKEEISSLRDMLDNTNYENESTISEPTWSKDQYLFLEQHKHTSGETENEKCNIGLMIDFPMYSFNKEEGVLRDETGNLTELESLIIVYGSGSSRSGAAGGGAATGLRGISEVPYTSDDITIEKITETGTIYINYLNNNIELAVGEEWRKELTSVSDTGDCSVKLTETHTVTNHGIFDKDKIELPS